MNKEEETTENTAGCRLPPNNALEILEEVRQFCKQVWVAEEGELLGCKKAELTVVAKSLGELQMLVVGEWRRAVLILATGVSGEGAAPRLLGQRVAWLTEASACGVAASHACHVWLTAHIRCHLWLTAHGNTQEVPVAIQPHANMCLHERCIPDIRQELINLDYDNQSRFAGSKIFHLLSKGLPKRCQIRELSRFLVDYMKSDVVCRVAFTRMLVCSLAGLWQHCRHRAPFPVMVALVSALIYSPSASTTFVEWLDAKVAPTEDTTSTKRGSKSQGKQQTSHRHQGICFFIIREFICVAVASVPTLRAMLYNELEWKGFETESLEQMELVRENIYADFTSHLASGEEAAPWRLNAASWSLQPRSYTKRQGNRPRSQSMNNRMGIANLLKVFTSLREQHIKKAMCSKWGSMMVLQKAVVQCIWNIPSGAVGLIPRLQLANFTQSSLMVVNEVLSVCQANGALKRVQQLMQSLLEESIWEYSVVEQELHIAEAQLRVAVYPLPQHHMEAQTIALNEAWQCVGGITGCAHCGVFMFCLSCGDIKSALSTPVNPNKRKFTMPNIASVRVAVNDDEDMLVCEKAHGNNNNSRLQKVLGRPMFGTCLEEPTLGPGRIVPSTFDSVVASLRCNQQGVAVVPMCGNLVWHANKLYTLCISCARIMVMEPGLHRECHWCKKAATKAKLEEERRCGICRLAKPVHRWVWCTGETVRSVIQRLPLCNGCSNITARSFNNCVVADKGTLIQKYDSHVIHQQLRLPGGKQIRLQGKKPFHSRSG